MYNTTQDIKALKSKNWNIHKNGKPKVSVGKVISYFKQFVDFDVIAENCSNNPNHEMFGKTVEVIRQEWSNRGEIGMRRGKWLDSYIHDKLHKIPFDSTEALKDDVMVEKFKVFDNLRDEVIIKSGMRPIVNELWLNSSMGVRGKVDELFYIDGSFNGYVVADWKNTEKIGTYSKDKMLHCLSHLPSCELYEYYLQVYIYQYILRTEFGLNARTSRVFQISKSGYNVVNPPTDFKYDSGLIKEVLTEATKNIIL